MYYGHHPMAVVEKHRLTQCCVYQCVQTNITTLCGMCMIHFVRADIVQSILLRFALQSIVKLYRQTHPPPTKTGARQSFGGQIVNGGHPGEGGHCLLKYQCIGILLRRNVYRQLVHRHGMDINTVISELTNFITLNMII